MFRGRLLRLFAISIMFAGATLTGAASEAVDPVDCEGPVTSPQTFTAEWNKRDTENQFCAGQRGLDQASNPLFAAKLAMAAPGAYLASTTEQISEPNRPRITSQLIPGGTSSDPFRTSSDWATPAPAGRGRIQPISFIAKMTGAKLAGEIWQPPASAPAPYPGIIISTGGRYQYRQLYLWAAEGLAEAGYMVLTYDSQGQGGSETFNHTDNGASFCTARGCPGGPSPTDHVFGSYGSYAEDAVIDAIKFFTSTPSAPYATQVPNTVGTDLYNPLHASLDRRILDQSGRTPLGLAGHSLGAAFAMIQGQLDRRVAAIVSWDGSIWLPTVNPDSLGSAHAPTLTLKADYSDLPTYNSAPPNQDMHMTGYEQLRNLCREGKQCVDVMQIGLRAATHWEWSSTPYGPPRSRLGERVSMYYTRAWFDRYVKGPVDPTTRAQAFSRLRSLMFDGSADDSSIGAGVAEVQGTSLVNKPYLISGKSTKNRLSFYYRSRYYLHDGASVYECLDIRAGTGTGC